jgi:hypothetical protein
MLLHALLHREEEFQWLTLTFTEDKICEMFKSFELSPLAEFGEGATLKPPPALGRRAGYTVPFDLLPSVFANDAVLPVGYAIHVSLDSVLVPEDPALKLLLAVLQVVAEILFQLCIATFAGSRQRLTH